jgi:hypothetical protein
MTINKTKYKDIPALAAETEQLKAVFLPEYGGKCASLVGKKTGREFLSQGTNKKYKKLEYDGDYVAAECTGFDDMFPAIDAYYYDRYPWQGVRVPDHGEVCGLKWQALQTDAALTLYTHSPRFGYSFEKTVTEKNGALSIGYKVTNNTQFPFDFIYAAHCMIAAEKGGTIFFPGVKAGEKSTLVFSGGGKRGRYGSPFVWDAKDKTQVLTPEAGERDETYKFFFDDKRPEGRCEYRYAGGTVFALEYSADKLPYLGVWINNHAFHGLCSVAFEPCSGSFDRPDAARIRGQGSVLSPYASYEWNITFSVEA